MIVFFINHPGGLEKSGTISQTLGGYSNGIYTNVMVFELNPDESNYNETIAHEVYHSLGLPHTLINLT